MKLAQLPTPKNSMVNTMAKNTIDYAGSPGIVQDISSQIAAANAMTSLVNAIPGPSGIEQALNFQPYNPWRDITPVEVFASHTVNTSLDGSRYIHAMDKRLTLETWKGYYGDQGFSFETEYITPDDVDGISLDTPPTFVTSQGVVAIASLGITPSYWKEEDNTLVDLPNLGEIENFGIVRQFRGFLLGLQVKYKGKDEIERSDLVWSDPHEYNSVPQTWDFTEPTNNAGRVTISSSADLLDSLPIGDMNFLYKRDSVFRMVYTGGQYVFRFTPAFEGYGILATGCVTAFGNKHFVVGEGQLYVHDGSNVQEIGDLQVNKWFYNRIDENYRDRVFVHKRESAAEIWICYPTGGSDGRCSEALVWNWERNQFGSRRLDKTLGAITVSTKELARDLAFLPSKYPFVFNKLSSTVYVLWDPQVSYMERQTVPLGPLTRDGQISPDFHKVKVVRELRIQADTTKSFYLKLGAQEDVDDTIEWGPEVEVFPDDRIISYPISGTFISLRLRIPTPPNSLPGFNLKQITFVFEMLGDL